VGGWDHLAAGEVAFPDQGIEIEAGDEWEEQEEASGMGREGPLLHGELPHIRYGICRRPWSRKTFVVGPARKAGESFLAEDFGDRSGAEVVLSGSLEFVADVVNRVVLLAEFDHPRTDGVLLGLGLGTVGDVPEEVPIHEVSKAVAENAEGAWLISEPLGNFLGGPFFDEVGAEGFVLALGGAGGDEEGGFLGC
jgi:hypothetical protein